MKTSAMALIAIGAFLCASSASAAERGNAGAQARYQQDRAACMNGTSNQDRATCLREAGAALQESRNSRLENGAGAYDENRYLRCDPLPAGQREDCVRRMSGEGTVSGSVEGGGIYRELVTPVTKP